MATLQARPPLGCSHQPSSDRILLRLQPGQQSTLPKIIYQHPDTCQWKELPTPSRDQPGAPHATTMLGASPAARVL